MNNIIHEKNAYTSINVDVTGKSYSYSKQHTVLCLESIAVEQIDFRKDRSLIIYKFQPPS